MSQLLYYISYSVHIGHDTWLQLFQLSTKLFPDMIAFVNTIFIGYKWRICL